MKKLYILFVFVFTAHFLSAQCIGLSASVIGAMPSPTYSPCAGSASISVTGGTAPFSYYWFPGGQTTSSVSNICEGNHKVFVIDSSGCADTALFSITGPPHPCIGFHILVTSTDASDVDSCDGSAICNVTGGVAPFSYNWGIIAPNLNTISNVCPGFYYVHCTDSNACEVVDTMLIYYPGACELFKAIPVVTGVSAVGATNGAISLNLLNGTPPYTYNWQTLGSTSSSLTGLPTGFYPVTVTDSLGCEAYAYPSVPCPGFSVIVNGTTCPYYACATTSFTAVTTGGTPPFSYTWWNKPGGAPIYYNNGSTTQTVSNYSTYWKFLSITTDNLGCVATGFGSSYEPSEPTPCDNNCSTCGGLTVYYATDQNSCDGVIMPPAADLSTYYSTPPVSSYWPATNSYSSLVDSAACANTPLYCITTDSRGCEVFWPGFVGILNFVDTQPLDPDTTGTRSSCIGSAKAIVASTFPPFGYNWDNGETTNTATSLCVGLHSVNVVDGQGLLDTGYVVVSNAQQTYLNNQFLPSPSYIYTDPLNDCALQYEDITNVIIAAYTINGPNQVNVTWKVEYASAAPYYISRLYYVIPNNVVEFIIGIYCEMPDSNYITARDRISFNPLITSVSKKDFTSVRFIPTLSRTLLR